MVWEGVFLFYCTPETKKKSVYFLIYQMVIMFTLESDTRNETFSIAKLWIRQDMKSELVLLVLKAQYIDNVL